MTAVIATWLDKEGNPQKTSFCAPTTMDDLEKIKELARENVLHWVKLSGDYTEGTLEIKPWQ